MSDQYQWWRDAVAGKHVDIHADHPQSGYFKMRRTKDGPWMPVAIWTTDDGVLRCRVGLDADDAFKVWTFAAANPVARDAAKHAFSNGLWPGDIAIGHNSGDLSLADEIRDARQSALDWLHKTGVVDAVSKDTAANYRTRLQALAKKADAERETKKRPHDDAAKAVQAEYKPLIDIATEVANTLRDALSKYMAAEDAKAKAAAAEAARIENERRHADYKRELEEQIRKRAKVSINDPLPLPIAPPVMVAPAAVKVSAGGQAGRKVGLREIARFAVSDYVAALAHAKDHPEVRAAVEKVCFAQARAGADVPGVVKSIEHVAV